MDQINSEILRQFQAQSLNINEGIAKDTRLVKSAGRQISNDKLDVSIIRLMANLI